MVAHLSGHLEKWPTKDRLAEMLRDAGFRVAVGRYSVRIEDSSHFVFQEYVGDPGDPQLDADADSVDELTRDATRVSEALARVGIRHRFEIYDDDADDPAAIAGYLHHKWPLQ
jgi:hypothetical protein